MFSRPGSIRSITGYSHAKSLTEQPVDTGKPPKIKVLTLLAYVEDPSFPDGPLGPEIHFQWVAERRRWKPASVTFEWLDEYLRKPGHCVQVPEHAVFCFPLGDGWTDFAIGCALGGGGVRHHDYFFNDVLQERSGEQFLREVAETRKWRRYELEVEFLGFTSGNGPWQVKYSPEYGGFVATPSSSWATQELVWDRKRAAYHIFEPRRRFLPGLRPPWTPSSLFFSVEQIHAAVQDPDQNGVIKPIHVI